MDPQKKGTLIVALNAVIVGLQPVIARGRPAAMDAFFYASATVLFEGLFLVPSTFLAGSARRRALKTVLRDYWPRVLLIGVVFASAQILVYVGIEQAGSVTLSVITKMEVVYSLVVGYYVLKERVTRRQAAFAGVALVGVVLAITQGHLATFAWTHLVFLVIPVLWLLGHAVAKPLLARGDVTPVQLTCLRTLTSAAFLIPLYAVVAGGYPWAAYLDPGNLLFILLIALSYLAGHLFWYTGLRLINLTLAYQLIVPSPIFTALFAYLLLAEPLTIYHAIGVALVVGSLLVIVRDREPVMTLPGAGPGPAAPPGGKKA